ncbi:hypothetical protein ScPMuIL_010627 [Solemya velum]
MNLATLNQLSISIQKFLQLKSKTGELNKACEKHYQLEQELAFHKIDSKFDSLGRGPEIVHMSGDGSGLEESPYLGRARYKANRYSQDGMVLASPQHATSHSVSYLGSPQKAEIQNQLDQQLVFKQDEVAKAEDRLKRLQDDLNNTERKLLRAAKDVKQMGDMTHDEEFRAKLRQRLAKKMEMVNELRDGATQIEEEIDKTRDSLHDNKVDVARLKGKLDRLDNKDPSYRHVYAEMVDKEQQISESNQMYGQLQQQLETMLDRIATETEDIKKLEIQLNEEKIEQNDELRAELDEIVGGLQGYLQNVQQQGTQRQQEFDKLLSERENLSEKVRNLENELGILNTEANNMRQMERKVMELEETLNLQQDLNKTLEEQLHKSRQFDAHNADKMENVSSEARQLQMSLHENELKSQMTKQRLESQIAEEKARVHQLAQKAKEADSRLDQVQKLSSQLEKTKAENSTLRGELENNKQITDSKLNQSINLKEMRKRLKELSHAVKTGKSSVEPLHEKDILGKTFKDLQIHMHDVMNESMREASHARKHGDKAEAEIQALQDQLRKNEARLNKIEEGRKSEKRKFQDERKSDEIEKKRLQDNVKRLEVKLKDVQDRATQGMPMTRIVYAPGSETDRSSLNSEEKQILDDLQRELLDLKRAMRQKEQESNRLLVDAEADAAMLEEALRDREDYYEEEIRRKNEEAELLKEQQDARLQVIAQDLEYASQTANQLQQLLDDREGRLHEHMRQSDLSTQVIGNQEEELGRLYEILEAQRDEIDYLNDHLDNLALRGGEVDPAFDEELWRLRQEVNHLKETLAMERAYIQTMPQLSATAGTQVQFDGTTGTPNFPTSRPHPISTQTPGISAGRTQPTLTQHQGAPSSFIPPPTTSHTVGTGYAPPPGSGQAPFTIVPQHLPGGVNIAQSNQRPHSNQVPALQTEAGRTPGPLTSRPHGTRTDRIQPTRHQDQVDGDTAERSSQRSRRSHRSRRSDRSRHSSHSSRGETQQPSAFLPISRQTGVPTAMLPVSSNMPRQDIQYAPTSPAFTSAPQVVPGSRAGDQHGPPVRGTYGPINAATDMPVSGPQQNYLEPGTPQHKDNRQSQITAAASRFTQNLQPGGVPQVGTMPSPNMYTRANGPQIPVPHQVLSAQVPSVPPPMYTSPMSRERRDPAQTRQQPIVHPASLPAQTLGPVPQPAMVYVPVEGANSQPLGYKGGRRYLQAFPTAADRPAARIYYRSGGSVPMQMAVPQLAPQVPVEVAGSSSPGPHVSFLPMAPLAAGTPVGSPSRQQRSFSLPPSPIRLVEMDGAQPRGILKNPAGQGVGDDSYLFCNVPEHHELEDYIAELQEKVKRLKIRIVKEKDGQREASEESEYRLVKRLQGELEERRDELEGLDLAIERQKRNLKKMRSEEQCLFGEREMARDELNFLRVHNEKLLQRRREKAMDEESDESLDEKIGNSRQKYIKDEMDCLQKTLAKRRLQLREADRLLKECNTDLKDAKEEARQTVKQFEDATHSLKSTVDETSLLEKRANKAGIELVRAAEQLNTIRSEVKEYEKKKSRQERLLKEVNSVIAKRDSEFKELDMRAKAANKNLQRVQLELETSISREKDLVDALRDSEDLLAKRRSEVGRMREQVDGQRAELEKVDQQMGKKRTELQFLKDSMERKKVELTTVLREAESEVIKKQNELKDHRTQLRELEIQRNDMNNTLKGKRGELHKLKKEIETEEEVLQKLSMAVNKQKSELKHTYDMQKIEQNELDNLKSQHAHKLLDFEKTQKALQEERKELEKLNTETSKKSVEMERLREMVLTDRQEVEHLSTKKNSLGDRIKVMMKEKEMLGENCKALDNKINEMKRSYHVSEEKLENASKRLESVLHELQQTERELEDSNQQKTLLQREVHSLKLSAKESKVELKSLKDSIREAEEQVNHLEMDLRTTHQQRDDVKFEIERLNEAIRQSRVTQEECSNKQVERQEDMEELIYSIEQKEKEYDETRKSLNRVQMDLAQEETRLSKLISNANVDLDQIRSELASKQAELERVSNSVSSLKNESEKLHVNEVKFGEMEEHIRKLEKEVFDRTEEKSELAKALTRSYEELQKLRKESTEDREKLTRERLQFESTLHDLQEQLNYTRQEVHQIDNRSSQHVQQLQNLAEQQFLRASQLSNELTRAKKNEARKREEKRSSLQNRIWTEKNISNFFLILSIFISNFLIICQKLYEEADKENILNSAMSEERRLTSTDLKEQLVQEQEQLRYQLQSQMQLHASAMEKARLHSEGTIDNLRKKLNALQEVLVQSNTSPDVRAIQEMTRVRARSSSPDRSLLDGSFLHGRQRSPSPQMRRSYLAQRPKSRSKSLERELNLERDYMAV